MNLVQKLSWEVRALKPPPKWGSKTTKEKLEELQKTKHTPGKEKKRGKSRITFEGTPGRFSGRSKPRAAEEEGKRCGDSWISKDDTCHINEVDAPKTKKSKIEVPPKKQRSSKLQPSNTTYKKAKPLAKKAKIRQAGKAPARIKTPVGKGVLLSPGHLNTGEDGIYAISGKANRHREYFPFVVGQAAAQYISSQLASSMRLAVFNSYTYMEELSGQQATGNEILPYRQLDAGELIKLANTDPDMGGWFIHSVLVRHDAVVGNSFNNIVMLNNRRLSVLHFDGTLLWEVNGTRRVDGMGADVPAEINALRSFELNRNAAAVFSALSQENIISAINKYLKPVEERDILSLVQQAQLSKQDRITIGKGLVERKRFLENM